MKYFLPLFLLLQCSVVAQKPLFPAYDFFKSCDPAGEFAYLVTNAYYKPGGHTLDSTAIHQWISPMDSIQRFFFFASASFWVFDNSDTEQLMAYLPDYEQDFIKALHSLSFSPEEIACLDRLLEHLSSLKRLGAPFRTYYGCDISFRDEDHALLIHRFARAQFNRLFATDLFGQAGVDTRYTGLLSKKDGHLYYALQVKNGIPVMEEQRDSSDRLLQRSYFNAEGQDSCKQWFYPNGQLWQEETQRPQVRTESEYYASGKAFRTNYRHYRDSTNQYIDSSATVVFHENGQKLYESTSISAGFPTGNGYIEQESAWDEQGRTVFGKGNGIRSTYELKDGKLHYAKQELELDSSLFLPFTPLLHWEDATRALVDSVTKRYLRTHSWTDYRTDARACFQHLSSANNAQLDSTQQAVLAPVFEIICSVYAPWAPEDSIGIAPLEPAKYPDEKWHKAFIIDHYHGFPFREATLDRLYRLDYEEAVKEKTWFYAEESGTNGIAKSAWDALCFKIQYLKQTATPDELITWLCEPIGSLHYLYPEIWAYDTIYPSQNKALAVTRDTMERIWLPQLKKLNAQVWKKLGKEERQQVTELRKIYQEFITTYRANSALLRYRIHRNQTPQRTLFIESLYDFMEGSYPNFRYMNLTTSKPAGLSRNDLTMLSRSIYDALGAKKQDLEQIEKQLFASLAPCSSIWITPFSWYWRGQDQEMLRALNLMMLE
ncbi:MAG TPA: hypothetical protein DCF33_04850 [Saprospirales bacterium]|nr:hypothetical protein [Saprospirales bacterium]